MERSLSFPIIKQKLEREFRNLEMKQVTPWIFLNTGKPFKVNTFNGREIYYEGVHFTGSPREVFWGPYIRLFLEDIVDRAFSDTRSFCIENNIPRDLPLEETSAHLQVGCLKIYNRMRDIDQRLCGKGFRECMKKNIEVEIERMREFIFSRLDSERRFDSKANFSVPLVHKKRPPISLPDTPREAFKPEPTVAQQDFEGIISTISLLSKTMERSPAAFSEMSEEHIRDHILVSLNGVYEGAATGETFNSTGKTDILIREKSANVFVAECKFWNGEKALHNAIDQLLGYVTWRDTKVALILFSKNKDFTNVLASISRSVPKHPNCKKDIGSATETDRRYLFSQKNDVNRDVHLAVISFDIPSGSKDKKSMAGSQ